MREHIRPSRRPAPSSAATAAPCQAGARSCDAEREGSRNVSLSEEAYNELMAESQQLRALLGKPSARPRTEASASAAPVGDAAAEAADGSARPRGAPSSTPSWTMMEPKPKFGKITMPKPKWGSGKGSAAEVADVEYDAGDLVEDEWGKGDDLVEDECCKGGEFAEDECDKGGEFAEVECDQGGELYEMMYGKGGYESSGHRRRQ